MNCVVLLASILLLMTGCTSQKGPLTVETLYDIDVNTIAGEPLSLGTYRDKVLLIVNTASKCGFTGQYEGLEQLYQTYADRGLIVLGFPSNDFLGQEPGSNEEIQSFCRLNYGVTFPMFAKIAVKGKDQHLLYRYLTGKESNPQFGGNISWNFNKFLIGRDGTILGRYGSRTKPMDPKLVSALEAALKMETQTQ